jgi:hypothetical protein
MKNYEASMPRTAILIAAAMMTALTLGLSILPAKVNSGGNAEALASRATVPAESAAPSEGMPIVVYGTRQQETVMQKVKAPHVVPPQKQQI